MLKRLIKAVSSKPAGPDAAIPPGMRVYAIGDVHGRLDCLDALLAMIDADDAARGPADTQIVLLGDLVDRGPDSAGVVERAMTLAREGRTVRGLKGNHEEMFLAALAGNERAMRGFAQFGGRETLLSYGMSLSDYNEYLYPELVEAAQRIVPPAHLAYLDALEDMIEIGDYLFVHAGIRPGIAFSAQKTEDLRWIRREFLEHRGDLGRFVIHGHTITPDVDIRANRIGIDTGAYESGRLTAIGLEERARWFLQTSSTLDI
ncbi:serine/threonine protein phosphatase [Sphingomonas spermidinifaciens]|uniref:Serine/threonine protein phosphatase n=1 Tax=Sphingomonas spermidinifaciens TaxID=1141889 RepID=A0A2A4B144_9SPHN|nr:metallophosphoesterase family protein [Sphingomonas spermidinifaciens]PCD01672.1 serine/threonine protein phosphatase [Sphingomonas spermidinifaciens]